jgi:hypothetical protein
MPLMMALVSWSTVEAEIAGIGADGGGGGSNAAGGAGGTQQVYFSYTSSWYVTICPSFTAVPIEQEKGSP